MPLRAVFSAARGHFESNEVSKRVNPLFFRGRVICGCGRSAGLGDFPLDHRHSGATVPALGAADFVLFNVIPGVVSRSMDGERAHVV